MVSPHSTSKAQEFFIRKITAMAEEEGVPLSRAEQYMLRWSEEDRSEQVDEALTEEFERKISMAEYEKKIARLIARAYRRDAGRNPGAKEEYRRAYQALKLKDNYLFVMVDKAVGRHLNRLRSFFGMYESGREYFLKAILHGILASFMLCAAILTLADKAWSFAGFKELLPQIAFGIAFLLLARSNITRYKNYKKEHSDDAYSPGISREEPLS